MIISARVIQDSTSSTTGIRLVTLALMYPRLIHSEFMTHRVFSRNASSSRAIPVKKMLELIRHKPAMPVQWGSNQPGMQAGAELEGDDRTKAIETWMAAAASACEWAEKMLELNVHKQIVNRITEPFAHIQVLVTATEWSNFFTLRDHKDAQPEIRALAIEMKKAMESSVSTVLQPGEWHLPFVHEEELDQHPLDVLQKISTARCARVSYLNFDGTSPSIEKDMDLYDKLITSRPIHASPCEHQATPLVEKDWSGNFQGWLQYRKIVEQSLD